MQSFVVKLKTWAKRWIAYSIEEEYKVYRLKGTPLRVRYAYTKKFHRMYDHVPICRNKIVFDNYLGNGFGCNGKYVLEELLRMEPNFAKELDLVWIVRNAEDRKDEFPPEVRLVEYGSEEALGEYATAGIWVKNYQMVYYLNKGLKKRPGQVYIQMWHGSLGIKKIEGDCDILTENKPWLTLAQKNVEYTDYWISNSTFETQVYKDAFWGAGRILEYGHPRNDIFFELSEETVGAVKRAIIRSANRENKKVVLYVPTFRDQDGLQVATLDAEVLLKGLQNRFGGEWILAIRQHPRLAGLMKHRDREQGDSVIDVTDYPDIQELLAVADVVITDYSSAIFDFMLTEKPGFLLAEDYENYKDMRGLYYPLEETPFPLARSEEELLENIAGFDEDAYKEKVRQFLHRKGTREDGNAAKRVVGLIKEIISKDEKND